MNKAVCYTINFVRKHIKLFKSQIHQLTPIDGIALEYFFNLTLYVMHTFLYTTPHINLNFDSLKKHITKLKLHFHQLT